LEISPTTTLGISWFFFSANSLGSRFSYNSKYELEREAEYIKTLKIWDEMIAEFPSVYHVCSEHICKLRVPLSDGFEMSVFRSCFTLALPNATHWGKRD